MTQISRHEFDELNRAVQQLKGGTSPDRIKELEGRIKNLEAQLDLRPQLLQEPQDIARIEAIFDIMVRAGITDQAEIRQYLDLYPVVWDAILQMLIAKGYATEKQFYCHILAYHHMIRAYGLNPDRDKVDLFAERIKYAAELEKLLEPLKMAGR